MSKYDNVRYQNTVSSVTSEQKDDRRLIDMMYAFDDEISRSIDKSPNSNNNQFDNKNNGLYDSYFNTVTETEQQNETIKNNNNDNCFEDDKIANNDVNNGMNKISCKIFKKKIVNVNIGEHKNIGYDTHVIKEKIEENSPKKNFNTNIGNTKIDLNKFKIELPAKPIMNNNSQREDYKYNKVIINNVNNNNNNNIIITSLSNPKDNKEDDDLPLTQDIINSIKPRNNKTGLETISNKDAFNTSSGNANSELACDSQNIVDFKKSLYTKHINSMGNEEKSQPKIKSYASCAQLKRCNKEKPKRRKSTDLPLKRIRNNDFEENESYNEDKREIMNELSDNEDIEMKYLEKLSKLKGENNTMKSKIESLEAQIKELNEKYENKNKEAINYKSSYDTLTFEFDVMNKKYEELKTKFINTDNVSSQIDKIKNDIRLKEEKEKDLIAENEKLRKEIKDLQSSSQEDKNGLREAKSTYESMKSNYNEMKNQYDLLVLKNQNLSEENFTLKRELLLYKGKDRQGSSFIPTQESNTLPSEENEPPKKTFSALPRFRNKSKAKPQIEETPQKEEKQNITPVIPNTITNSRRRPINSMYQNDSSNVSSLLTFSNEPPSTNENKKIDKKQSFTKISEMPSQSEQIAKEAEINKIESVILQLQQEREKFSNELSKLPEYPKHQSTILKKRNCENEIEQLNLKINDCRKRIREINKAFY